MNFKQTMIDDAVSITDCIPCYSGLKTKLGINIQYLMYMAFSLFLIDESFGVGNKNSFNRLSNADWSNVT